MARGAKIKRAQGPLIRETNYQLVRGSVTEPADERMLLAERERERERRRVLPISVPTLFLVLQDESSGVRVHRCDHEDSRRWRVVSLIVFFFFFLVEMLLHSLVRFLKEKGYEGLGRGCFFFQWNRIERNTEFHFCVLLHFLLLYDESLGVRVHRCLWELLSVASSYFVFVFFCRFLDTRAVFQEKNHFVTIFSRICLMYRFLYIWLIKTVNEIK